MLAGTFWLQFIAIIFQHCIPLEKTIYVQLSVFDRDFTLGGHIFVILCKFTETYFFISICACERFNVKI